MREVVAEEGEGKRIVSRMRLRGLGPVMTEWRVGVGSMKMVIQRRALGGIRASRAGVSGDSPYIHTPWVSRRGREGRNCARTREWMPSAPTRSVPVADEPSVKEAVTVPESVM